MGHQVFIIARVKARGASQATYRSIAGYRQHYCDGDGALEATLRFLHALKQPENADVVREEIRSLDGHYGAPGEKPEPSDMPCGFLSTVLAASWDVISREDRLIVDGTWLWEKVVSVKGDMWRTSFVLAIHSDFAHRPFLQRGRGMAPQSLTSRTSSTHTVRGSRATAPDVAGPWRICRNTTLTR